MHGITRTGTWPMCWARYALLLPTRAMSPLPVARLGSAAAALAR
jgi:hypothetical protein